MRGCLHEGALAAYLDGELPEATRRRAAGHLQSCARCRARLERVEATAARVNALLDALVDEVPVAATSDVLPFRARPGSDAPWVRWAVAAAAGVLAISAVLGVLTISRGPQVAPPALVAKKQATVQPAPAIVSRTVAPAVKPKFRRVRRSKPLPRLDDFLALDDGDPIQVGVVVRVMLPASAFAAMPQTGAMQVIMADLAIGEDGRARAIRFVP
jgi:predicted anti-sigma-YlaC factor YlaD